MLNKIDIKAVKLNTVGTLLNDPKTGLTKNRLILVTDSALIYGTFVDQNTISTDAPEADLLLHKVVLEAAKNASQHATEGTINSSVSIVLKDVTVLPFAAPNVKINLATLSVFSDQIVGYTYGYPPGN